MSTLTSPEALSQSLREYFLRGFMSTRTFCLYDCATGIAFAVDFAGLTDDQVMHLESAAYDAAGGRYPVGRYEKSELPPNAEVFEGSKRDRYFGLV